MLDRCCTAKTIGRPKSNFWQKPPTHNGETRPLVCYNIRMGNTVGSLSANFCNFPKTAEDYYILGLWCADGYHWSSSIGLSNIDTGLVERFRKFFQRFFAPERIKLHIHSTGKRKHLGYQLYVNSRPLRKIFMDFRAKEDRNILENQNICAYLAGRFDGDGCIDSSLSRDCRISYGNQQDAILDYNLLKKLGFQMARVYQYRTSSTYVIYISRFETQMFVDFLQQHSLKLQKLALRAPRDFGHTIIKRDQDTKIIHLV